MQFNLPWPPSVNHYWVRTPKGMTRSEAAKGYLHAVSAALIDQGHKDIAIGLKRGPHYAERLRVQVIANPPDRRRRDLDNLGKAVCDALEHFRLCRNDSQIDDWHVIRGERVDGGKLVVFMEAIR
jgi:crossover junction endodeoxyribonuclease RusA